LDIINLIASLISGAIGGHMVGGALNDQSLGSSGDSLLGVLGGGIAGVILQSLGIATGSGSDALDAGSLIGNIAICGIGGALVTLVIGLIKGAMARA
jgi:uncharacterized membrane protein YeaQ/YmgE (transglycosylase-associated protein family)